jgi:predicted membrane chloride channel (bestrophin family)
MLPLAVKLRKHFKQRCKIKNTLTMVSICQFVKIIQMFAVALGYLVVFRTQLSIARYWEAVSSTRIMYTKWTDA